MSYRRQLGQAPPLSIDELSPQQLRAQIHELNAQADRDAWSRGLALLAGGAAIVYAGHSVMRMPEEQRKHAVTGLTLGALGITLVNHMRWMVWPASGGPIGTNIILGGPPSP